MCVCVDVVRCVCVYNVYLNVWLSLTHLGDSHYQPTVEINTTSSAECSANANQKRFPQRAC